ncbi:MAG: hypothetical protein GAK44_00329 [Pseudomonas delhiensis]|nr:MAG: hypothetical protein GAK44_00329 [Pseudomonas delhiensis]
MRCQQQVDHLARVRGLLVLRQAHRLPMAVSVLTEAQVQPLHLQCIDPRLARQQAGQQVRRQPHSLQAQGFGALADLHITDHDNRIEALPLPIERADMHRQAEALAGLFGQGVAVLGHQRRQLAAKAHVQREQYQHQGAGPQAQAQ